jgi:hypothetical protein
VLCFDEDLNVKASAALKSNIRDEDVDAQHDGSEPDCFGNTAS